MMPMQLLPTTVVAAILLFVLRELLEILRARRVGNRRRIALRTLLAKECELNDWAIRRLREEIQDAEDSRAAAGVQLSVIVSRDGQSIYRRESLDRGVRQWVIPHVRKAALESNLLEIATLDKQLFTLAEQAYGALSRIEQIRDSFIHRVTYDPDRLPDFCNPAIGELNAAFTTLSKLQDACARKLRARPG